MKNWKTTAIGIAAAIVSVLTFTGVLSPEQADGVNEGVVSVIENIGGVIAAIIAALGFFAKDGDAVES